MPVSEGVVYCLVNSAKSSVVKIGKTVNPDRRLREHNAASNVIGKWRYAWTIAVPLAGLEAAERDALVALGAWKVRFKHEQFRISAQEARRHVALALHPYDEWGRVEKARECAREEQARADGGRRWRRQGGTGNTRSSCHAEFVRLNRTLANDLQQRFPDLCRRWGIVAALALAAAAFFVFGVVQALLVFLVVQLASKGA